MPIPRFSSKFALLIAMAVVVSISGCVPWARGIRTLDESVTDWRDYVWGKRAFYQRYGRDMSGPFMDGFLEGYHDMLQGGDGCVPVVPPRRYWSWKYQSAGGQGAVNEWFEGYRAGVAAAREDGLANISSVPVSSQYNGMSTVPIQGVHENDWTPIEEISPNAMPIPPSVEPGDTSKKGALFFNGNQKSLVKPASARQAISTSLSFPNGKAEVSPMIRNTNKRAGGKGSETPLGTSARRSEALPPIVSSPLGSGITLPPIR